MEVSERLTRWEGVGQDGLPRAVLARREGSWIHNMDDALRKLAQSEDMDEAAEASALAFFRDGGLKKMHDRAEAERQQRVILDSLNAMTEKEMMPMNKLEILRRAIETYGAQAQELMLLEEMSELQKEICKYRRGNDNRNQIAEEIADVEIMLEQMKMIFCCGDAVSLYRIQKLKRLERRLNA